MLVKLGRTITLAELAKMTEASLYNVINPEEIKFDYVTTDSREVKEGCLFVALKGENFDGNEYIEKAADKGAVCTLCSKLSENVKIPCAHCEDTLTALGIFAKKYKRELSLKTCAVTGSVGKTTTKEFIYAVMSNNFNTAKSEGNYNNEIGLPMTLLQLDEKIDCAVVEVGMNFMREVANLSEIAHPDYAVITNIGTSHIENLGSRENICKAKLEIAEGLSKDGILFYNGDEVLLREGVKNLSLKCVAVGFEEGAQIRAIDICEKEDCIEFDIYSFGENRGRFKINVLGKHNVYNAWFAYAVGRELCMDDDSIRNGLIGFKNTGMRQRIYSVNGVKIIEDCYNASPESMKAAISVLSCR